MPVDQRAAPHVVGRPLAGRRVNSRWLALRCGSAGGTAGPRRARWVNRSRPAGHWCRCDIPPVPHLRTAVRGTPAGTRLSAGAHRYRWPVTGCRLTPVRPVPRYDRRPGTRCRYRAARGCVPRTGCPATPAYRGATAAGYVNRARQRAGQPASRAGHRRRPANPVGRRARACQMRQATPARPDPVDQLLPAGGLTARIRRTARTRRCQADLPRTTVLMRVVAGLDAVATARGPLLRAWSRRGQCDKTTVARRGRPP